MRVVGYVRDTPDPAEAEPAFAQAERVRRWVADSGHQLIAVCQDVRTAGHSLGRDGYRAMIGIIASGEAEAVILPSLNTLSPDKVSQEIMLWDLRARGVAILSTDDADLAMLTDPPEDSLRILIRDVLAKVANHFETMGAEAIPLAAPDEPERHMRVERPVLEPRLDDESDVVIELIPPAAQDPFRRNRITPAL